MTTYSADAALTFTSQSSYANHSAKSRFSDGKARRKRAFDYVRVSTEMQAQYSLSLEVQKDQIAAYARAYSYEVVGGYVDHDSAKNTHGRPEYLKMVAEIDRGIVAFAQLERERISERVKGIIGYIRSQGGHFGQVPFGYMAVNDGRLKRLVQHPENFAWLERMAEWRKEGMTFEAQQLARKTCWRCLAARWGTMNDEG